MAYIWLCERVLSQERYANPRLRGAFNRDVRMALATSKHWGPSDYLQVGGRGRERAAWCMRGRAVAVGVRCACTRP